MNQEFESELQLNKIYCMDAIEGLKKLPDNSVDLIVTDPPYYIQNLKEDLKSQTLRRSSKNSIFHADWDSIWEDVDEYKFFVSRFLKQFKRVLKGGGSVICFFHIIT